MCADGPVQGGGVEGRIRGTNVTNTYCVPDSELQIITIIGISEHIVRARCFTSLFRVIHATTPRSGFYYLPTFSEKETQ